MTAATETRAKYTSDEIKAMGAKGQAFKNPDGSFSYPVGDAEDLGNAIHAVGRGGADHDAIRKYIIGRAKALGLSSKIPGNWGADGSLGESKAAERDPAWELRRKRWAGSLVRQAARRSMKLARGNVEVRAKPDGTGGTKFEFHGYGATFNDPFKMWDPWGDEYDEEVVPGSFTRSLARADLDTPFLIGHNDSGIPLARTWETLAMSQDTGGLETLATMNGKRSDVRDLALAVEDKNIDEMSIGFVTLGQHWSEDWSKRYMTDLDLHRGDVSVVALAANPATKGASMVALPTEILSRQAAEDRARGEVSDSDSHPDFDLPDPADNGAAAVKCPYTGKNGCGQMLPGGSKFCPNCGGPVYDGDGTLVVDDSGVVEASEGDADLLSRQAPNAETLTAWLELEGVLRLSWRVLRE